MNVRRAGLLAIVCTALFLAGCVRRTIIVTSNPDRARTWINGVYRGHTPVEIPFLWNWYYDLRLESPGYERLEIRERFDAPPQHKMGPDLLMEFIPWKSREDHVRHYDLKPLQQL